MQYDFMATIMPQEFFSVVLRGVQRGIDELLLKKVTKAEKLICYNNNEPKRVPLYFYQHTDFI